MKHNQKDPKNDEINSKLEAKIDHNFIMPPTLKLLPKVNDFGNCLKCWKHRKLSLMGKVTMVKTFALPKLIYPLIVPNNPPEDIINKIK